MMQRAYAVLELKSVDDDQRIIEGIASTPTPDRTGDVLDPIGASFQLPMPLLWQHKQDQPIGQVLHAEATKNGIKIRAKIAKDVLPRIDEAWALIKSGLVRGLSVGFMHDSEKPPKWNQDTGGMHFNSWKWLELSAVTIPANADANITTIKSISDQETAALGTGPGPVIRPSAGVSAPIVKASKGAGTIMAKTFAEQITAFEATRQAKTARMTEIMTKAGETGETLDPTQAEEYDRLQTEIASIDEHLKRLDLAVKTNITEAKPVAGATPKQAAESRTGVVVMKSDLPKGTGFVRYVKALVAARGSKMEAAEYAKRWNDSTPEVALVLKAAVTEGDTTTSGWASQLVVYQNLVGEFAELLRPATIIGKINGFRRVPFNVTVPRQLTGSTVNWVGQGLPKPVGELSFDSVSLGIAKAAGIIVISEELARSSDPSAEAIISQDLRSEMAEFLDEQFINPAVAAVTNVSPAAVTNGATVIDSTGVTAAFFRADFASALAVWSAANMSIAGGVIIMTESQAIRLSMIMNAFGQPEFPQLTATGGTLFGLPVITSENIPAEGGSPAGERIILLKPGEILLADEGGIAIDVSREASVQMDSAPAAATTSTIMRSFWQENLVGIRAERYINWLKRRTDAAVIIEGAVYTG